VKGVKRSAKGVKRSAKGVRRSRKSVKKVSRTRSYTFFKAFKDVCRGAVCGPEKYVYFLNKHGYDRIFEFSDTENDGSITVENKEKLDELVGENGFRIKLGSKKVHSKFLVEPLEIDREFKEEDIEPLINNKKNRDSYSKLLLIKALGFAKINENCNKVSACEAKIFSIAVEDCFIYFSGKAGGKITIKNTVEVE